MTASPVPRRGLAALLCLAGVAGSAGAADALPGAAVTRGQALFVGEAPLVGRIALHPTGLPPEVLRCANCHASARSPQVARTVAPALTRAWLLGPRERRGGPVSIYEGDSFCRLLRTGQDPARLVVNMQMPRYTLSEQDCADLWRYLTEEDHG